MEEEWIDYMSKAFEEQAEYEEDIRKEYKKALRFYKKNISFDIKKLRREDEDVCLFHIEEDGFVKHIGYCNVEEFILNGKAYYKLTREDLEKYNICGKFEKQSVLKCGYHELCLQWCDFEDSYHGYMLFPMKDGRYWIVYYEC